MHLKAYLKIHGIKAQEHPVFKELARVRQYFAKIKKLEDGPEEEAKPSMKLDQQAARRFINHSLVCSSSGKAPYNATLYPRFY